MTFVRHSGASMRRLELQVATQTFVSLSVLLACALVMLRV